MTTTPCARLWTAMHALKAAEQRVSTALVRAERESFDLGSLRREMNKLSELRSQYQKLLEEKVDLGVNDHRQIQLQDYLALRRMVEGCKSTERSAAEIWSALLGEHLDLPRLQLDEGGRVSGLDLSVLSLSRVSVPGTLTSLTRFWASNNQLTQLVIPGTLTSLTTLLAHRNQLTQLVIPETLTSLTQLYAYNNKLTQLEIPGTLTRLEWLGASNNQLTQLVIPGTLKSLTELHVGNNPE